MKKSPEQLTNTQRWIGVMALAMSAFVVNTTEFAPVALFSDIAQSFGISASQAGLMLTVYAWTVAVASLPIMLLTRKMDRKKLLIGLFLVFIVAHLLSFFAWQFEILLVSRFLAGLCHALFWSITSAIAVRIAPQGKETQALGLLSTGTVLALVMGVPLGRFLGDLTSWQTTFLSIGAIAGVGTLILMLTLPSLKSENTGSLASLPILFKRKTLVLLYVFLLIIIVSQFTAYSYIEPFMREIAHFSNATSTVMLLIYGGAGIIGSYLFGQFSKKFPLAFPRLTAVVLGLCLFLLLPFAGNAILFGGLMLMWGVAFICLSLVLQVLVLKQAHDATDVAMSMLSGIFNIGIGAGALFGGTIIKSDFGLQYVGGIGGAIAIVAMILMFYLSKRADF